MKPEDALCGARTCAALSLVWFAGCGDPGAREPAETNDVADEIQGAPMGTEPAVDEERTQLPQPPLTVFPPTDSDGNGALELHWGHLGDYDYRLPDPRDPEADPVPEDQIPDEVAALDGSRVELLGHFIPSSMVADEVSGTFVLHRYLSGCCYGRAPRMNEWIEVRLGDVVLSRASSYVEVRVTGTLRVGEERDEDGYLLSVYRLDFESMEPE